MPNISAVIEEHLLIQIREIAKSEDRTVSNVVERLIKQALENNGNQK